MTINKLIKELEKIQEQHGKRLPVVINRRAIDNWNSEEYSHCDINGVTTEMILWAIDDNVYLKSGKERYKKVCTLGDP